jgi:isocitrate dehydrogenase
MTSKGRAASLMSTTPDSPSESTASNPRNASRPAPVAVAHGDGIGPEIMDATLEIISAAGARIETHQADMGEAVYRAGHRSGIDPEAESVPGSYIR